MYKIITLSYTPDTWYNLEDGNALWGKDNAVVREVCELTYQILVNGRDSERKEDRNSFCKYVSKELNK